MGLQTGGRLLLATHLDQSKYLANQQHMLCRAPGPIKLSSQSSTGRVRLSSAFCQTQHHVEKRRAKLIFAEANWHVLPFLHPIFVCCASLCCTGGAALITVMSSMEGLSLHENLFIQV